MRFRLSSAPFLRLVGTNWVTLFGASLTTVSFMTIFGLWMLSVLGFEDTPYLAALVLLVLPGIFILGLLLIPVGLYWQRRLEKSAKAEGRSAPDKAFPVIDLNRPTVRRLAVTVGALTIINLFLVGMLSYGAVTYMDSSEFCGEVCHTVMEPEFTAYVGSPHSRVECVACHIGPGADWFVRSKMSGARQVIAVTLHTYATPIPTPVENLRPSQETCEQCHWPERFSGDLMKVITHFSDDEETVPKKTILLMHIGGGPGRETGIHSWHIDPEKQTTYIATDAQRQRIAWVQVKEADGTITEYFSGDSNLTPEAIATAEKRTMDCIDCHNRPTHIYRLPGPAVDAALLRGAIDSDIPFIKKTAAQVLTEVGQNLGAPEQVVQRFREFYLQNYSDFYNANRQKIEQAVQELESIYRQNVFPEMKVTWGTYPNNIGHENYPGCFRCHDGDHTSPDGKSIEQDCTTCHNILAWDEESPEIASQLGLE